MTKEYLLLSGDSFGAGTRTKMGSRRKRVVFLRFIKISNWKDSAVLKGLAEHTSYLE